MIFEDHGQGFGRQPTPRSSPRFRGSGEGPWSSTDGTRRLDVFRRNLDSGLSVSNPTHPLSRSTLSNPSPSPTFREPASEFISRQMAALPSRAHIDFSSDYQPPLNRASTDPTQRPRRSGLVPEDASHEAHKASDHSDGAGVRLRRRRKDGAERGRKRRPSWKKLLWVERACASLALPSVFQPSSVWDSGA